MADTAEEAKAARVREREKPFWDIRSADDIRNLLLGVIGGLLVVVIVALALIVNRHLGHLRGSAVFYLAISGGPAVLLLLAVVTNGWLRKALRVLSGTAVALIVVLGLLLFLGEAAGIH
jgi:hypothetical protein